MLRLKSNLTGRDYEMKIKEHRMKDTDAVCHNGGGGVCTGHVIECSCGFKGCPYDDWTHLNLLYFQCDTLKLHEASMILGHEGEFLMEETA